MGSLTRALRRADALFCPAIHPFTRAFTGRRAIAPLLLCALMTTACEDVPLEGGTGEGNTRAEDVAYSLQASGDVENAVRQASCQTDAVFGLSQQLIAQMRCSIPDAVVEVSPRGNVRPLGPAYLQAEAASALFAAAGSRSGTLQVNSALRTVAQQYLLYRWGQQGRCGIQKVSVPGGSNHESGLAVDVNDPYTWRAALEAHGFRWLGESDRVHFDFRGGRDLRRESVLAFQRLWNQNHPEDRIAEDGVFGPQMEARLQRTPAGGFAHGPSCGASSSGCTAQQTSNAAAYGCACVDGRASGGYCEGSGCTGQEEQNCAAYGTVCVDHVCSGGFGEGHGCTAREEQNCAAFGTACVDHRCNGGFAEGHGCTAREEQNCAAFGTACVDHACSGGFAEGHGCTALEEKNCAAFGTVCVDHACSGGFGEGHGCTALEEKNCAAFGTSCVDHLCSGGFGEGSGCTAKETRDCDDAGQACRDHLCVAR
jgi:hypothetical protein